MHQHHRRQVVSLSVGQLGSVDVVVTRTTSATGTSRSPPTNSNGAVGPFISGARERSSEAHKYRQNLAIAKIPDVVASDQRMQIPSARFIHEPARAAQLAGNKL